MQKRKLPPLRMTARRPPPSSGVLSEPLPGKESAPPPEPDSGPLGRHHQNLKTLSADLSALEHLSDLWRDLAAELEKAEAAAESTVEQILSGAAGDAALNEKSVRIASLGAQIATLRKRANVSGTALQTRLQKAGAPS